MAKIVIILERKGEWFKSDINNQTPPQDVLSNPKGYAEDMTKIAENMEALALGLRMSANSLLADVAREDHS